MPRPAGNYVMPRTTGETRRLRLQGSLYAEHTDDLLTKAGIRKGMRVLDVGCGAGDVTLQVARMVGPEGSVIGVDLDRDLLDVARDRAAQEELNNVVFEEHDLHNLAITERFDALVGRLILMHLDDPVRVLKSMLDLVHLGGVVTFQDFVATASHSRPAVPLFAECVKWITEVLRINGRDPDIGRSLQRIFTEAGLRPQIAMRTPTFSYRQSEIVDFTVSTVTSVADLIVANQLATDEEVASLDLADRLHQELTEAQAEIFLPTLVGIWATKQAGDLVS